MASIVLVSLSSARLKSKDAAALSTAQSLFQKIGDCALAGGTIASQPTSSTTGGGTICSVSSVEGTWPDISNTGYDYLATTANIYTRGNFAGKYWLRIRALSGDTARAAIVCNNGYAGTGVSDWFWSGAGWTSDGSTRQCEQKIR